MCGRFHFRISFAPKLLVECIPEAVISRFGTGLQAAVRVRVAELPPGSAQSFKAPQKDHKSAAELGPLARFVRALPCICTWTKTWNMDMDVDREHAPRFAVISFGRQQQGREAAAQERRADLP